MYFVHSQITAKMAPMMGKCPGQSCSDSSFLLRCLQCHTCLSWSKSHGQSNVKGIGGWRSLFHREHESHMLQKPAGDSLQDEEEIIWDNNTIYYFKSEISIMVYKRDINWQIIRVQVATEATGWNHGKYFRLERREMSKTKLFSICLHIHHVYSQHCS